MTFVPCFLWIFLGAPYVERLRERPRLIAALAAITAAVVGVILNLAVWFALHVLFARIDERWSGRCGCIVPDPADARSWALLVAGARHAGDAALQGRHAADTGRPPPAGSAWLLHACWWIATMAPALAAATSLRA